MNSEFKLTRKTFLLGVSAAILACLLASLAASSVLIPQESSSGHEHMHGAPGPFFQNLFKVYVPRRSCMFYEPGVIWLHFISDFLIAISYFSIPIALVYFIRHRRDLAFTWIFWMFAAFILLCGTTHLIGMWDLWQPLYKIDGIVKFVTGVVSVFTAISLWPLIPRALALPSPAMLEERVKQRTAQLASLNAERELLLEREKSARDTAERANRLKDEFLATLSHELRTPLNAILGWSQILKRRSPDESIREGLETIERNSRLQATLIEDLLDMSSIVSGKLLLNMKEVNLPELIDAAIESIRPAAENKQIQIKKLISKEPCQITADGARLQQVLWNLLSNAVKFTPVGGIIEVKMMCHGQSLELEVIDSGIGIKPDFLPFLFDRFSQADSSTTRRFGGLGLGLAISKNLVEMHGGTIVADSPGPGKGARFRITLPYTLRKAGHHPVSETRESADFISGTLNVTNIKVLVVDDQSDSLLLVANILKDAGIQSLTASSAKEAWNIISSGKPDIIICDIGMPGEDGHSFLERLRKMPESEGGNIPAIALSAFADRDNREKSLRSGFALHISKPFEPSMLIDAVLKLVS